MTYHIGVHIEGKIMRFKAVKLCLALLLSTGSATVALTPAQAQVSGAAADLALDSGMATLRQNKLFELLFRTQPGLEAETRAEMRRLLTTLPADQAAAQAQVYGAKLMIRYVEKYTLQSSDASLNAFLQQNLKMVKSLQGRPEACVAYVMGTGAVPMDVMTPAVIAEETEIKYQLLESAINRPVTFTPLPLEKLAPLLQARYAAIGADLSGLALLGQSASLPPAQGCQVVTQFSTVMAAGSPAENAAVYKGLLYLGKQAQGQ